MTTYLGSSDSEQSVVGDGEYIPPTCPPAGAICPDGTPMEYAPYPDCRPLGCPEDEPETDLRPAAAIIGVGILAIVLIAWRKK